MRKLKTLYMQEESGSGMKARAKRGTWGSGEGDEWTEGGLQT